jgi:hypothetical protein
VAVQNKEDIAELWLRCALLKYPNQGAEFLATERDAFRNPAGSTIRRAVETLLDELLQGMDHARVTEALDSLMQIRAIQGVEPGSALEFLFQLKGILRDRTTGPEKELLDSRIDNLALLGFDLFMKYRERTYQARANEARRRVFVMERRMASSEAPDWDERGGI